MECIDMKQNNIKIHKMLVLVLEDKIIDLKKKKIKLENNYNIQTNNSNSYKINLIIIIQDSQV